MVLRLFFRRHWSNQKNKVFDKSLFRIVEGKLFRYTCYSTGYEFKYFSDSKIIRAIGGKGGDGYISFLQLWCNERAGPDGGDGGNGGHIIFKSSTEVKNFNHIISVIKGKDGENGTSNERHGKNAPNSIIKIPIGTLMRNVNRKIVCDFKYENLMYVVARGGSGGKGNKFFTTSKENSPKVSEYGSLGEDILYTLELRTVADVGIIGRPNVGKSTLLARISNANPKIAPYPFTTLHPRIGVVQYEDYTQLAVADLPGLIHDSSQNKGLGIRFLKHIERCSVLLFILDVSIINPWEQYNTLIKELKEFSPMLYRKPKVIVANKIDKKYSRENFLEMQKRITLAIIPINAKSGENIEKLLTELRQCYDKCSVHQSN